MSDPLALEIRFESIGGLGANLAAQLVAESLVLRQGLNASQFSSYGSEKKGTPVRSFIRIAKAGTPIRVTSPVTRPAVLAVFHPALLARRSTLAGLRPDGALIINTPASSSPSLPRGHAWLVDATAIALEEKTRLNTAVLGAVAKACPAIDAKALAATLEEQFTRKSAKLAEANVKTFWRGYNEAVERVTKDGPAAPPADSATAAPMWGYETAPLGGTILTPGNSIIHDHSASRQGFAPRLNHEKCTHCGVCDLVCPDYCLVWDEQGGVVRLLGIDYQYCKGCQRCVESCPSGALTKEREDGWVAREQVKLWPAERA